MTFALFPTDPGITRQLLSENPDPMVVSFSFEAEAEDKLRDYPHVQSTHVEARRFAFAVDELTHDPATGGSHDMSSGPRHAGVHAQTGTFVETSSPRRNDFL